MPYLNREVMEAISAEEFQKQRPYPWASFAGSLTNEGFESLRATLPDVSTFERHEGVKRAYGQGYHNRYILHYRPWLELAQPWKEFAAEILGERYLATVRRLFRLKPDQEIIPTLEWYYAWEGCSVSPHCDARRKLGTHIFYFNTEADWDPRWGGEILIMDDAGQRSAHSAPSFDDLKVAAALKPWGNGSLLFERTDHSWHGVRPLGCPKDHLRKLFIVTINLPTFQVWWRRLRGKDPDGYRLRPAA